MKMKFTAFSLAAVATVAMTMSSYAATGSVTPAPLPAGVTGVTPPQGWISLDSQYGYQLGISAIDVRLSGDEIFASQNPDIFIELYKDGATTPIERLSASEAYVAVTENGMSPGFKFKGSYTKKGVYKVVIPAGVWCIGNATNLSPEITLNYELTNDMILLPAPGIVNAISDIEVIFPSAFESVLKGGKLEFYKIGSDTSYNPQIRAIEPEIEGEEQNRWNLHFATPITEAGEYILRIEEGEWGLTWYGEEFSKEPGKTRSLNNDFNMVHYYIPELSIPASEPATGSELTSLGQVKITVPEYDRASFILVNTMAASYLYPASEEWELSSAPLARYAYYQPEGFVPAVVDGSEMMFDESGSFYVAPSLNPDEAIVPAPGNYILKLGTKLYYGFFDGKMLNSSPYEFRFTVIADPTVTQVVNPSGLYDELSKITVRFPHAQTAVPDESETAPALYLKNAAGDPVAEVTATSDGGIMILSDDDDYYQGASVDFVIEPAVVMPGTYTLDVPEGYITLNGKYASKPMSFVYEISGILSGLDEIASEASCVTVYTTEGICVLKNAPAAELQTLPKGLYIVNGKKQVVR